MPVSKGVLNGFVVSAHSFDPINAPIIDELVTDPLFVSCINHRVQRVTGRWHKRSRCQKQS